MIKKADIVLLICFIVFAIIISIFPIFSKEGNTLVISINNEEYMRVPLNEDTKIELPGNTVIIKDGYAYVEEAKCPDKVCINQGKISNVGETIICLPAKAVLEVE